VSERPDPADPLRYARISAGSKIRVISLISSTKAGSSAANAAASSKASRKFRDFSPTPKGQ
jgi:hypothetical protein